MATCRHSSAWSHSTTVTPAVGTLDGGGTVEGDATVDEYDAVRARDDEPETVRDAPERPLPLTYTSGTTGRRRRPDEPSRPDRTLRLPE